MRSVIVLIMVIAVGWVLAVPYGAGSITGTPDAGPVRGQSSGPASTVPFLPNIRITDGSSPFDWQVEPTMVLNGTGSLFVGWKETDGPETAGRRVGFSYSTDHGRTWAPNILMNQSHPNRGCHNSDPWMALDPTDRVHFGYLEYDCGSGFNVANTTTGNDWGSVHYIPGHGGLVDKDSIAFDTEGRLYAAWDEGNVLALTSSDDDGGNWAPIQNPGNITDPVLGVVVATRGNSSVYLTWWDISTSNIMFEASADRGQTWSAPVQVNSRAGSASQSGAWQIPIPAMNVDRNSGAIYIAWPDVRNGNQDIFFANSTDGGKSFGTNRRINDDNGSTPQWMVDLAIDGHGTVHAAWEDGRDGNWNIFYSNSTDGGATWSANLRVSSEDTSGSYNRPGDYFAIEAGRDDSINVVWTDGRGSDFDIFFARSPGFPVAEVTVTTNPIGLPVTVDGVTSKSPVQSFWPTGSSHNISTTSPIPITPTSRYNWTGWDDGGAIAHTIVAAADRTITASFQKEDQVIVDTSPKGRNVLVDSRPYAATATFWWVEGTDHAVEAKSPQNVTDTEHYVWSSWSDGGDQAHSVRVSGPMSLIAVFRDEQTMVVSTSPAGRSFTVDGVSYSVATTFWFPPGTYHVLDVPTEQSAPGARYRFTEWSDGGASNHVVAFQAAMALQANFSVEYYLNVSSLVPGTSGSGWYPAGSTVVAGVSYAEYATGAGERLVFLRWGGDGSGTGLASDPIVMDGPKTVVAEYGTEYRLTVSSDYGDATGGGWYPAGSTAHATVSATEVSSGSGVREVFVGWTGDAAGSASTSNSILMDRAKRATASWETQYFLRVDSDVGTVEGSGWYPAGQVVVVRAPAQMTASGTTYQFAGWMGDATASDPSLTVTMSGPLTVRATWQPESAVSGLGYPEISFVILVLVAALVVGLVVWRRSRRRR